MCGWGYSFSMLQMLNMLHVTLMKISDFGVSFGRFRGSFILPLKWGDRKGLGDRGGLTIWLAWEKARSKARKICRGFI